jgi:hypothetical protein
MELADDRGACLILGASTPCSTAREAVVGGDCKTKFAVLHNRFLPERVKPTSSPPGLPSATATFADGRDGLAPLLSPFLSLPIQHCRR